VRCFSSVQFFRLMMTKLFATVAAAACAAAAAWGNDGHKIVAQIASGLLSSAEEAKAAKMAGASSLADIASWADEVRHESAYRWSAPLHFINNPDGSCKFDYNIACKHDFCAAGAILNFTNVAMDNSSSQQLISDAIRFVVHFLGDIHQPLHVGWTTDDGGNEIKVEEGFLDNKQTELHAVWDSGIIDRIFQDGGYSDWSGYEKVLAKDLPSDSCFSSTTPAGLKTCVEQMAQESLTLACQDAYRDETGKLVTQGEVLDEKYYTTRKTIVASQLQKAGVRLATLLRFILSRGGPSPSPGPAPAPTTASCKEYGCGRYSKQHECQCNMYCKRYNNCCSDYDETCGNIIFF